MEETTTRSRRWRIFFRVVIVGVALGVMLLAPLVGLALWPGLEFEWQPVPRSPSTLGWGIYRFDEADETYFGLALGSCSAQHTWTRHTLEGSVTRGAFLRSKADWKDYEFTSGEAWLAAWVGDHHMITFYRALRFAGPA